MMSQCFPIKFSLVPSSVQTHWFYIIIRDLLWFRFLFKILQKIKLLIGKTTVRLHMICQSLCINIVLILLEDHSLESTFVSEHSSLSQGSSSTRDSHPFTPSSPSVSQMLLVHNHHFHRVLHQPEILIPSLIVPLVYHKCCFSTMTHNSR